MSPPNVLIIMSDEHNPAMSSPYGHTAVRDPAMQCLADAVFENAYCNFPLCAPSRASFMTGRYASDIGVWDNGSDYGTGEPTWAHRLNARGYATTLAGRMHFIGPDVRHGFARTLVGDHHAGRWEPLVTWASDPKQGSDPEHADMVADLSGELLRDRDLEEIDRRVREAQWRRAMLLRGDVEPNTTWVRD